RARLAVGRPEVDDEDLAFGTVGRKAARARARDGGAGKRRRVNPDEAVGVAPARRMVSGRTARNAPHRHPSHRHPSHAHPSTSSSTAAQYKIPMNQRSVWAVDVSGRVPPTGLVSVGRWFKPPKGKSTPYCSIVKKPPILSGLSLSAPSFDW